MRMMHDAVILSRTQNGLQETLYNFYYFMKDLDLRVNISKAFIMRCGHGIQKRKDIILEGNRVTPTKNFSYLGVLFSYNDTWNKAVVAKKLAFVTTTSALASFAKKLGRKPPLELIKIYKAKCVTSITYGAGIWGFVDTTIIQTVENHFIRHVLSVPSSTSTYVSHSELGLSHISDLIRVEPLLLWHRIWSCDKTSLNREVLQDSQIRWCFKDTLG